MTAPQLSSLPVDLADPVRARVGLIALATDMTTEVDFARVLVPQGIAVHTTRIPFANPVTPATLAAMEPDITEAASLILPDEPLAAVVYSCTSASVVIGDDRVRAAIAAGKPGATAITPISAGTAGLKALGARRISLLTPYDAQTTQPMADLFEAEGFDLMGVTCMGLTDDRQMARITPDTLARHAKAAVAAGSDALFLSCTAVGAVAAIEQIERAVGVPVVSSNLATLWAVLRATGNAARAVTCALMDQP
ncbi:MAG: ectoine utilization protein EutA [Paracoccus denitrificans]|nr:MAG: ectoine utilization protein EutA [Paracoccus denitrificans]PZO86213.1 MAG: ectoine utilization protein EutA [Paracoccus denitrificans]